MKKVIGYYYFLHEMVIEKSGVKAEDFVGRTVQLCFGTVKPKEKLEEESSDDVIEQMLNSNIGKIVEVKDNIAKVMLTHPVPEDIFKKHFQDEEPIFEE